MVFVLYEHKTLNNEVLISYFYINDIIKKYCHKNLNNLVLISYFYIKDMRKKVFLYPLPFHSSQKQIVVKKIKPLLHRMINLFNYLGHIKTYVNV